MTNSNVSLIYKSHTLYTFLIKILYGKYFLNRYRDLRDYIPIGDSVLDVCSGDCNLYHFAIKGRNKYTGVDLNISGLKKNKNVNQKQLDIVKDALPNADIVILQGSLYQFQPNEKLIIDKLLFNAKKKVMSNLGNMIFDNRWQIFSKPEIEFECLQQKHPILLKEVFSKSN